MAVTTYFVSTTGNDTNSGTTIGSPWRHVNYALNNAVLGSTGLTITVAAGNYNEDVSTTRSGTATAPILLISDNPSAYSAIITGVSANSVVQIGSGATAHGGNYITVQGFEITGTANNQGVTLQSNHSSVIRNKIHDIQRNGTCPSGGGGGVAVQWNGVAGTGPNDPTGINFNTVDGNIIYNVGSWPTLCNYTHGIYLSTPYNTVINNLVFHCAANGIITYHYVTNNTIVNNTVFGNVVCGIFISADNLTEDFTYVANNISINNGTIGIRATEFSNFGKEEGANNVFTNNLTFGNGSANYLLDGPLAGTAINSVTSGTNASVFINYTGDATGDYHLAAGSPAIGAASATYAPNHDLANTTRTSPYSIGAYSFGSGSVPSAPTGLTAVGI